VRQLGLCLPLALLSGVSFYAALGAPSATSRLVCGVLGIGCATACCALLLRVMVSLAAACMLTARRTLTDKHGRGEPPKSMVGPGRQLGRGSDVKHDSEVDHS
jgi:hypothetical protein